MSGGWITTPGLMAAVFSLVAIMVLAYTTEAGCAVVKGREKIKPVIHSIYCGKNTPVDITPLTTDFGERLTIVKVGKPSKGGSAKLLSSHTIRYTPGKDAVGNDRFSYVIKDVYGKRATGRVSVRIWNRMPPNEPPVAGNIFEATYAHAPRLIKVLRGVKDREGDKLTISGIGEPELGTVTILRDDLLNYVPTSDKTGVDEFTYTVSDSTGGSSTGKVTMKILKQPSPETVGDSVGSSSTERAGLHYGGSNGCTDGTLITLNRETEAPRNQQVCGVKTTDSTSSDLFVYKGIQYADAPRWGDPKPPQWKAVSAVEYGPVCPQGNGDDMTNMSEQCLYLNVWTPKITRDNSGNLPVMVFIHGGAFLSGCGGTAEGDTSGHLNVYDGSEFVATSRGGDDQNDDQNPNVVVVTMNYRLGALGFLAGKDIGLEGNYGIKDQIKALEWVHRNISLFGGDPTKVMIFGESAGAQSAAIHLSLAAENDRSLFRSAIMESNYAVTYMDIEAAQLKADTFVESMECDGAGSNEDILNCLEEKDVSEILEQQMLSAYPLQTLVCAGLQAIIPWNPVIDGTLIKENPINVPFKKPVMLGSNVDESALFLASLSGLPDILIMQAYVQLTDFLFGVEEADNIRSTYLDEYPSEDDMFRFEHVLTDYLWTCFNRRLAASSSTSDVFRYYYNIPGSYAFYVDIEGGTDDPIPARCSEDGTVCHGEELPFVFGNPVNNQCVIQSFDDDEEEMSLVLRKYWLNFARKSDPNEEGVLPGWPGSFVNQEYWYLQIGPNSIEARQDGIDGSLAESANCDTTWDSIGYEVTSSYNCGDL